jgi:CelD/BcsL family acetyltransferase involved in cellulose biosynthesis
MPGRVVILGRESRLLHPGPLVAGGAVEVAEEAGASSALDLAAAADVRHHAFLRAAWFAAAAADAPLVTLVARRAGSAEPFAALPLVRRKVGFFSIREVPGSYWPYRSFPVAEDAGEAELAALLASSSARSALGHAWRVGPIYADDPTLLRLVTAARDSGWTVLSRRTGSCYLVDLKALAAAGPWPSSKTLRKNRWLERRLAEAGELEFRTVTGGGWTAGTFAELAAIEAQSWVARNADARDSKFLNPDCRRIWERAVCDPTLAGQLACSILSIGGEPAAFTFSLRCGEMVYYLANSYCERFAQGSPGRVLLYRDFQQAVADGAETIGWGAGDPGYKSEMGAKPGPDILDLLIVRGPLAPVARLFWRTRG